MGSGPCAACAGGFHGAEAYAAGCLDRSRERRSGRLDRSPCAGRFHRAETSCRPGAAETHSETPAREAEPGKASRVETCVGQAASKVDLFGGASKTGWAKTGCCKTGCCKTDDREDSISADNNGKARVNHVAAKARGTQEADAG